MVDDPTIALATEIANQQLSWHYHAIWGLLLLISSAVGSYLGYFFGKTGELKAIQSRQEQILSHLDASTKVEIGLQLKKEQLLKLRIAIAKQLNAVHDIANSAVPVSSIATIFAASAIEVQATRIVASPRSVASCFKFSQHFAHRIVPLMLQRREFDDLLERQDQDELEPGDAERIRFLSSELLSEAFRIIVDLDPSLIDLEQSLRDDLGFNDADAFASAARLDGESLLALGALVQSSLEAQVREPR
ncbi:MAG: hypothetical protein SGI99_02170 [Pseudomonadota bacterium]|nr:hypothetical protein [Pseudomonadota bacterium]